MESLLGLFREDVSKFVFYAVAQYGLLQINSSGSLTTLNKNLATNAILLVVSMIIYYVVITKFVDTSNIEIAHIKSLIDNYIKWGTYIAADFAWTYFVNKQINIDTVRHKVMVYGIAISLNNFIFSSVIETLPLNYKQKSITKNAFDLGISFIIGEYLVMRFYNNNNNLDDLLKNSMPYIGGSLGVVVYDLLMYT